MISAMLPPTYKPFVFKQVPLMETQVPKLRSLNVDHVLDLVAPIFVAYPEVSSRYSFCVIHRHFDLEEGKEILIELEIPNGSGSVAVPWKIEGNCFFRIKF